jgi:hypothetical protein
VGHQIEDDQKVFSPSHEFSWLQEVSDLSTFTFKSAEILSQVSFLFPSPLGISEMQLIQLNLFLVKFLN